MANYDPHTTPPPFVDDVFSPTACGKSRGITALLAIFLGGLGIQYFYLGKNTGGIIAIILSFCTCGMFSLLFVIQGILLFVMTSEEFERKFVYSPSTFPLF